jgi:hypothetical protein
VQVPQDLFEEEGERPESLRTRRRDEPLHGGEEVGPTPYCAFGGFEIAVLAGVRQFVGGHLPVVRGPIRGDLENVVRHLIEGAGDRSHSVAVGQGPDLLPMMVTLVLFPRTIPDVKTVRQLSQMAGT